MNKEAFMNSPDYLKVPPIECDLKVGDMVTYTNDYGVVFKGLEVTGFHRITPDFLPDNFIYLNTDAYWFPHKRASLKKEN